MTVPFPQIPHLAYLEIQVGQQSRIPILLKELLAKFCSSSEICSFLNVHAIFECGTGIDSNNLIKSHAGKPKLFIRMAYHPSCFQIFPVRQQYFVGIVQFFSCPIVLHSCLDLFRDVNIFQRSIILLL